eukprot:GHVS01089708.1.p1 GENE.GHVS01089708.1~~GHVS01089708.1.p1  ORF type:complete len:468 (+),score=60.70 GHVS01089708.1:438-1841(+)
MGNNCLGKSTASPPPTALAPDAVMSGKDGPLRIKSTRTFSQLLRRSMSMISPDSAPSDIIVKLTTYRPLLVDHVTRLIEKDVFAQTIDDESLRNLGVLLAWPSGYVNNSAAASRTPTAQNTAGTAAHQSQPTSESEAQRCVDSVIQALEADFKAKESKFSIARISKSGPLKRGSCVGCCEVQLVMFVNDAEPPFDHSFMTAVKRSLWKIDVRKVVVKGLKSAAAAPSHDGAMCISAVLNDCVDLAILAAPNFGSGQLQLRNTLDRMQASTKPNAYLPALCEQHSMFVSSVWSELHANGQALIRLCCLWRCAYDLKLLSQWSIEVLAIYIALGMRNTKPLDAQLAYFFQLINAIAKSKLSGGYIDTDCDVSYPAAVWWKERESPQAKQIGLSPTRTNNNGGPSYVRHMSALVGKGGLKVLDPVAGYVDLVDLVPRQEWSRIDKLSTACSVIMQNCTDRTLIEVFTVKS